MKVPVLHCTCKRYIKCNDHFYVHILHHLCAENERKKREQTNHSHHFFCSIYHQEYIYIITGQQQRHNKNCVLRDSRTLYTLAAHTVVTLSSLPYQVPEQKKKERKRKEKFSSFFSSVDSRFFHAVSYRSADEY